MADSSNTFQCSRCKGVFENEWTDEEALAETQQLFGTLEDLDVLCDDCFNNFMSWRKQQN